MVLGGISEPKKCTTWYRRDSRMIEVGQKRGGNWKAMVDYPGVSPKYTLSRDGRWRRRCEVLVVVLAVSRI